MYILLLFLIMLLLSLLLRDYSKRAPRKKPKKKSRKQLNCDHQPGNEVKFYKEVESSGLSIHDSIYAYVEIKCELCGLKETEIVTMRSYPASELHTTPEKQSFIEKLEEDGFISYKEYRANENISDSNK